MRNLLAAAPKVFFWIVDWKGWLFRDWCLCIAPNTTASWYRETCVKRVEITPVAWLFDLPSRWIWAELYLWRWGSPVVSMIVQAQKEHIFFFIRETRKRDWLEGHRWLSSRAPSCKNLYSSGMPNQSEIVLNCRHGGLCRKLSLWSDLCLYAEILSLLFILVGEWCVCVLCIGT